MEIHPTPKGHLEALVDAAPAQSFFRRLLAGVTQEHSGDIAVHMVRSGLDLCHAAFVGIVPAGVEDILRQVWYGEHKHIFMTAGLPELGFPAEHIFFRMCVKIVGGHQRHLPLPGRGDVIISGVAIQQLVCSLASCHGLHGDTPVSIDHLIF